MSDLALSPPAPAPKLKWLVVGLFIALCLPLLITVFSSRVKGLHILASPAIIWTIGLMLLAVLLLAEKRPLSSAGIGKPTINSILLGLLAGFVMMALVPLLQVLMSQLGWEAGKSKMAEIAALPFVTRLILVVTAGIVEEFLFRGYAITRLNEVTGSMGLASGISLVAFVLAHAGSWSPSHLITVFVIGGMLTALFAWKRNLIMCIVAHTFIDAMGFIVAPALV